MTALNHQESYSTWLGIAPDELPAHHYRLLGVAMFQSDPQAILAAYAQRTAQVSAHLNGPQAETARALLGELAAAQACLLDPQSKAAYDQQLQGSQQQGGGSASAALKRPAPRTSGHAVGTSTSAAVVASGVGAVAATSAAGVAMPQADVPDAIPQPANYRRPGEVEAPMTALPWLIGGVCAGLLGVCALAMILFGGGDNRRTAQVDGGTPTGAGQTGSQSGESQRRERRRNDRTTSRIDDDVLGKHVAPTVDGPQGLEWDRDPDIVRGGDILDVDDLDNPGRVGSGVSTTAGDGGSETTDTTVTDPAIGPPDATTETPESTFTFASLPKSIALPSRAADGNSAPVVLTRIDIDNPRDVQLKLTGNQLAGGSGRFELAPRSADADEDGSQAWDVQHIADGGQPQTVGQYTLADGELSFGWAPDATAEDAAAEDQFAQLQNQPLQITAGEESTTIAQRVAAEASPLVVKFDAGAVSTSVPVKDVPQQADLMFAIDELSDEFGEHAWEPANTIEVGKTTSLRLGSENDPFQLSLQITAEQAGPNKVRIEARPMFRHGNVKKWDYFRPAEAAQALTGLKNQQAAMDAQLQQIQKRYRRDQAARDQATAIHNQQSAVILENLASLERISDRCQALQDKGQLPFRIFAQSGEDEIDLVHAKAEESPSVEKQSPPDESIGAPIDANIGEPVED